MFHTCEALRTRFYQLAAAAGLVDAALGETIPPLPADSHLIYGVRVLPTAPSAGRGRKKGSVLKVPSDEGTGLAIEGMAEPGLGADSSEGASSEKPKGARRKSKTSATTPNDNTNSAPGKRGRKKKVDGSGVVDENASRKGPPVGSYKRMKTDEDDADLGKADEDPDADLLDDDDYGGSNAQYEYQYEDGEEVESPTVSPPVLATKHKSYKSTSNALSQSSRDAPSVAPTVPKARSPLVLTIPKKMARSDSGSSLPTLSPSAASHDVAENARMGKVGGSARGRPPRQSM